MLLIFEYSIITCAGLTQLEPVFASRGGSCKSKFSASVSRLFQSTTLVTDCTYCVRITRSLLPHCFLFDISTSKSKEASKQKSTRCKWSADQNWNCWACIGASALSARGIGVVVLTFEGRWCPLATSFQMRDGVDRFSNRSLFGVCPPPTFSFINRTSRSLGAD